MVVFELLGASVCIALLKIYNDAQVNLVLSEYINVDKATDISIGILLSVVLAFAIGAIVQFGGRLVFTFDIHKKPTWLKSLFSGVSLAAITYFILIKGINSIQFIGDDFVDTVKANTLAVIAISLIMWTIIIMDCSGNTQRQPL